MIRKFFSVLLLITLMTPAEVKPASVAACCYIAVAVGTSTIATSILLTTRLMTYPGFDCITTLSEKADAAIELLSPENITSPESTLFLQWICRDKECLPEAVQAQILTSGCYVPAAELAALKDHLRMYKENITASGEAGPTAESNRTFEEISRRCPTRGVQSHQRHPRSTSKAGKQCFNSGR